ncbi:MAG: cadmium-translocating P-type ATPase [Candidatus Aenigmatarchaeota archaeon]|nr:MAG: cadmium-translocating P-type ATPase [Candidatus Aenigmarchaeota archaeon]
MSHKKNEVNHNHDHGHSHNGGFWEDPRQVLMLATSGILFMFGLFSEFIIKNQTYAVILFALTTIISGYKLAYKGIKTLITKKTLNINFLISIAAVGSFLIGHGEEGAAVVFLFTIAELLEEYAARNARRSVHSLMELAPEFAEVKRDGKVVNVPVRAVKVDEIVAIRPGDKIPLDGVIVEGVSSVNQASITGESMPVSKIINDDVYAGSINNEGYLEVKVTKLSSESVLSKIVEFVTLAQLKKSPTEKFIDKFSRYYTPGVVLLAILLATVPPFVLDYSFNTWVYKSLVLLVISCPCALAISTPVSMVSGLTSGARNGVLIKGSSYVEALSKIKTFAFDKTGTLTEGNLVVTDVVGVDSDADTVLRLAASLEAMSEHPVAEAIVERYNKNEGSLLKVKDFQAVTGKGIIGEVDGDKVYVGNRALVNENMVSISDEDVLALESMGKTVVFVGEGESVLGYIAVMDKVRDDSVRTVRELNKRGLKTVMLTGDNMRTARAIAEEVEVFSYMAELLPEDKVKEVKRLREEGRTAMVGDGVNDAPALVSADIGIVMGAAGSDVALEAADVALMQDDISKLPYLMDLSKKTLEVVRQNILLSIIIKGAFAVLVFPGLVTLWMAVLFGDLGLTFIVILNAMRISKVKPRALMEHE